MTDLNGYMSHYGDITVCMDKPYPWFFVARYGYDSPANGNIRSAINDKTFFTSLFNFIIDSCQKDNYKDTHDTE